MRDWVGRPILSTMTDEGLPFQLLATQAVDAVVATSTEPSLFALASEGDLRSSVIAAVELLLLDLDKPLCPQARMAVASMVMRHLSTTGLFSPRDVTKFAVRYSATLATALREKPHLMVAETDLTQLLG